MQILSPLVNKLFSRDYFRSICCSSDTLSSTTTQMGPLVSARTGSSLFLPIISPSTKAARKFQLCELHEGSISFVKQPAEKK